MWTTHASPNLRWLRTHRTLTQHQLAQAAGVARSTIWLLEAGKEAGMPRSWPEPWASSQPS
jgi:DNA-binding XRE family transcriptional regulator